MQGTVMLTRQLSTFVFRNFQKCTAQLDTLLARSHCLGPGPGVGLGTELETIGSCILCRAVHTAPEPRMGPATLSHTAPFPFPVLGPIPMLCERAVFQIHYTRKFNLVQAPKYTCKCQVDWKSKMLHHQISNCGCNHFGI